MESIRDSSKIPHRSDEKIEVAMTGGETLELRHLTRGMRDLAHHGRHESEANVGEPRNYSEFQICGDA